MKKPYNSKQSGSDAFYEQRQPGAGRLHQEPALPGGGGRRLSAGRRQRRARGEAAGRGRGVHADQAVRRDAQGGSAALLVPGSVPGAPRGPVLADGRVHPDAGGAHRGGDRAVAALSQLVAGVPGLPDLPPLLQGLGR